MKQTNYTFGPNCKFDFKHYAIPLKSKSAASRKVAS